MPDNKGREPVRTEGEWQRCRDPEDMIAALINQRQASYRKVIRFCVSCCRPILPLLASRTGPAVIDLLERHLDVPVSEEEFAQAAAAFVAEHPVPVNFLAQPGEETAPDRLTALAVAAACAAAAPASLYSGFHFAAFYARKAASAVNGSLPGAGGSPHGDWPAELLRDIFGNPFRPVKPPRSWLSWNDGTVVKLAQHIDGSHDFSLLPILCDALEEAGCGDEDIITHCRFPREHVRGCWVVNALLGKS